MDKQKYLSIREVAVLLGLAEVTLRTWIASGKLNCVRFGRAVRIATTEVNRLIEAGSSPTQEAR